MSVIRRDLTTRDWVLIAPHRGNRPHDRALVRDARSAAAHDPSCPFCPGNEALTPPERFRIPDGPNGWAVRVVPNKFGVLSPEGPLQDREDGPLFRERTGVGVHEVIVETPLHNGGLGVMAAGVWCTNRPAGRDARGIDQYVLTLPTRQPTMSTMTEPHKRNRHPNYKTAYRVNNWREYEQSLRDRDDITLWISQDAIDVWTPPQTGKRDAQPVYSDVAIETALTFRLLIERFICDGIYDQEPVYTAVENHSPGARVIIPPRKDAVLSPTASTAPTQRDQHLLAIESEGRFGWKRTSGYYAQSHAENAFSRFVRHEVTYTAVMTQKGVVMRSLASPRNDEAISGKC